MPVEATAQIEISLLKSHPLWRFYCSLFLFKTGSFIGLELTHSPILAGQQTPGIYLPISAPQDGVISMGYSRLL